MAAVANVQSSQGTQAPNQVQEAAQAHRPRRKPQATEAPAAAQAAAQSTAAKASPHLGNKVDVTA